jgi:hypothetical protein
MPPSRQYTIMTVMQITGAALGRHPGSRGPPPVTTRQSSTQAIPSMYEQAGHSRVP